MIGDAAGAAIDIVSDVCVIGGGPAGIALALRLSRNPSLTVSLLESGGLEFEESTQELARAETQGAPYYPFHETRIRALGGASWSWGGVCTPLDDMTFQARPWLPVEGWPIPATALHPYLDDAMMLCGITPDARQSVQQETEAVFVATGLDRSRVVPVPVLFSRPTRFGVAHREKLAAAPNLRVQLHATVTRLETEGGRVVAVQASCRGRPFRALAKHFVLATGGVENPRLLLVSGIGGGATGRFFMEHPRVVNRYRIRPGKTRLGELVGGGTAGTLRFFRLSVADEIQRRDQLLTYHANLQFGYLGQLSRQWIALRRVVIALRRPWNESPYFQDAGGGRTRVRARDLATAMRRPDLAFLSGIGAVTKRPSLRRFLEVWSAIEQVPDRDNRIELLPEPDALGVPRVRVHWNVGEAEERTYRRSLKLLLGELEKVEPGISAASLDGQDPWPSQLVGNWHHEGTTRMGNDPNRGVVDRDCRVHGVDNLYVAGSSVFPVSGSTSPTVTIIQLALRLADHLAQRLGG